MVNEKHIPENKLNGRLSMRHSLMVWIAGAVLGWIVAVASVWSALSTTESNIASKSLSDADKMEQIVPAAGNEKDVNKPEY